MGSKIALFIPSLEGGGAEKCMLDLASGLAARNNEVSVIVTKTEGPYGHRVVEPLELVNLGTGSVWKSIPVLARYLRKNRPRIVISALEHANIAALVARHLSMAPVRVAVTTHTMVSFSMLTLKPQVARAMRAMMRALYPTADSVVVVSRAVARDLAEVTGLPLDSIQVIHNPVPTHEIKSLAVADVQTSWFDEGAPPVVIAVGSLWPHKGHRMLVEAVHLARRTRPVRLVILGEGPERKALEELSRALGLERNMMMPGFTPNPYSWIARSAVLALPSRWEGLPTVLVEAMACGVSPVATDCPGGSSEILQDGECGYLTPVDNAPAMADAILRALERPLDARILKARAEDFSVENAVVRYMNLVVEGGLEADQARTGSPPDSRILHD